MVDRQVKVTYSAQVAGYNSAMLSMARNTRAVGSEAEKLAQKTQAFQSMGRVGLTAGLALGAGLAVAIGKAAEFDQAMSAVSAATHETADNMSLLRASAIEAGARTVYSATEAANAIEELGKAGFSTADILGGALDGALDLAAAGGIGVAEAAGIAAVALKTYKLEGSDMAHVADLLAAGAGKAMGDVTDLSAALSQSGQVAASAGISLEETTATLAAFASQGLLGSDAGTSFKSMLQRLTPQSKEAADKMDELGISAYDAQGNFIGLESFAGNLQDSLKDLTTEQRNSALATIFGSDAVRAATVLYSEGSEGIAEWTDLVDDSGYAAETAALRLDNLQGDVEKLGGAFDSALISSGSAANDVLRFLTQAATGAVDAFNGLPAPVQGTAIGLGAVATAGSLAAGMFFTAVPKIIEYRKALDELGPSGQRAGKALAIVGKAAGALAVLAAAGAVVSELSDRISNELLVSADELTNTLQTSTDAADQFRAAIGTRYLHASTEEVNRQLSGVNDALLDARDNWRDWSNGISPYNAEILKSVEVIGEGLGELSANDLPAAQEAFTELTEATDGTRERMWALLQQMPAYKDALVQQANALGINVTTGDQATIQQNLLKLAMGEATPVTLDAADAYLEASDNAAALDDQLLALIATVNEANGVGQDAVSANIAYKDALADVDEFIQNAREGVEGYSLGLDQSTQSGRDNMSMLNGLADDYQTAADAQFALDQNSENYVANLQAGRDTVLQRAQDLGATDEQIQFLSDHIVAMPSEKQIKVLADTTQAQYELDNFLARNYGTQLGVGIYANKLIQNETGGFYDKAFAAGGFPSGVYKGGQNIHKFAETGLPWETYISPKPGHERENIGYALESLSRLGYSGYAGGSGASAQVAPASSGPMEIQGTLDLGNGLTGVIKGVLAADVFDRSLDLEGSRNR